MSTEDYWDLARLRLDEECNQLCLWKTRVTDQQLDSLFETSSTLYNSVGVSVLRRLLSIATLLRSNIGMARL